MVGEAQKSRNRRHGRRLREVVGKFRRAYLTTFRPGYVRRQRLRRRGQCLQCGRCCRLAHRCLFLTSDSLCRVYKLPRPRNCTAFPIDERDLADVDWKCGFRFEDDGADGPSPVEEQRPCDCDADGLK